MNNFLPTTKEEMKKLGWKQADIIIVTGDTYFDSPYIGAAVIGRTLEASGYKVAIIAQPNIKNNDITRLGEPKLFWGVTGGSVDSMVANYTASKKKRKSDDFTPGGINNKRPDRATIIYTNLIKKFFKKTKPIVLGGIEASLRRITHYDFWGNKLRKSILIDAEADFLLYGMADKSIVDLANAIKNDTEITDIKGLSYISKNPEKDDFIKLPSFDDCKNDKKSFIKMFNAFYENNDPITAKGLIQQQDRSRFVIQNPPAMILTPDELDKTYEYKYTLDVHSFYKKLGHVKALDTIQFSVTSHRGCYGECNFCSITVHQGKTIQSRSEESIIREVTKMTKHKDFKGNISDVGGPSANMYGFECDKKIKFGSCSDKKCLSYTKCSTLHPNHSRQTNLLKKLRKIKNIKKVFVASGIRYDLILEDKQFGEEYLEELVNYHISGQLKIAPEHVDDEVLKIMGKPSKKYLEEFFKKFTKLNKKVNKKQFLTYYLIAAHPGSTNKNMFNLKDYFTKNLNISPEQVQIFTPTPSTYSTLMYYTGEDGITGKQIFSEKEMSKKEFQKNIIAKNGNSIRQKTRKKKNFGKKS